MRRPYELRRGGRGRFYHRWWAPSPNPDLPSPPSPLARCAERGSRWRPSRRRRAHGEAFQRREERRWRTVDPSDQAADAVVHRAAPRARTSRPPAARSARPASPSASPASFGEGTVRGAARSRRRGGERCAAETGIWLLPSEGKGLGVTEVSSPVLGVVWTETGTVRRCPGPHPCPDVPLANKCTTRSSGACQGVRRGTTENCGPSSATRHRWNDLLRLD